MESSNSWIERVRDSPFLDQQLPAALRHPGQNHKKSKRSRKKRKRPRANEVRDKQLSRTLPHGLSRSNGVVQEQRVRPATTEQVGRKKRKPTLRSFPQLPSLDSSTRLKLLGMVPSSKNEILPPQPSKTLPISSKDFTKNLRKAYARK